MAGSRIKLFADGADRAGMLALHQLRQVDGFTTNPTLMRKAGIGDYEAFARDVLGVIRDVPVSFEVFSDEFGDMRRQALKIASWGDNVYVKIPITTTTGASCAPLIGELSGSGVKVNATALLTIDQVREVSGALDPATPAIVSIFAGRIADTGVDPIPVMSRAKEILSSLPSAELLWASCREVLNIRQAECAGCDIITVTDEILKKTTLLGKDLAELSLETVRMFHRDAAAAGFRL